MDLLVEEISKAVDATADEMAKDILQKSADKLIQLREEEQKENEEEGRLLESMDEIIENL